MLSASEDLILLSRMQNLVPSFEGENLEFLLHSIVQESHIHQIDLQYNVVQILIGLCESKSFKKEALFSNDLKYVQHFLSHVKAPATDLHHDEGKWTIPCLYYEATLLRMVSPWQFTTKLSLLNPFNFIYFRSCFIRP